jgi:2-phosphosulfolactate phosphatase
VIQADYTVRFEWGEHGVRALAATSDVVVIVDVLSFCTTVDVAVSRGASVFPFASRDIDAAALYADQKGAALAVSRQQTTPAQPYSLSPASVTAIPDTTRLVLALAVRGPLDMKFGRHHQRVAQQWPIARR